MSTRENMDKDESVELPGEPHHGDTQSAPLETVENGDSPNAPSDLNDEHDNEYRQFDSIANEARAIPGSNNLYSVPSGVRIVSGEDILRPGLANTLSINRQEHVTAPQSFVEFVRHFGSNDTIVFVDSNTGKAHAVINYIDKNAIRGSEENPTPPSKFRCDWRVDYEVSYTPEWKLFVKLIEGSHSSQKSALLLLQLRDFFIESDEDFDAAISFIESDVKTLLPKILDIKGPPATDAEMINLILEDRKTPQRMLINFALSVHAGCNALEAMVLVESNEGLYRFTLINHEQLHLGSAKSAITKIRTGLRDSFPVFDTDLENFDG